MNRKYSISRHTLARSLPMKMKLWCILTVALLPVVATALPESSSTVELQTGWRPASSWAVVQEGSQISQPSYHPSRWYPIRTIPATVLQILEEDGAYSNLYFRKNLTETVPRDLFRQDWWYRTTFTISTEHKLHWLVLKGINYRAEIWLNGERIVDARQVVGMYSAFEFNVTEKAKPGSENVLAVKVHARAGFRRQLVRLDQCEVSRVPAA